MPDDLLIRGLTHDGLYLPTIKPHSIEKLVRHNYATRLFSTAMKDKWPQRAYVGLYSGCGRARIADTTDIVETTAISALRVPDPFTHYVFVDNDARCIDALRARVAAVGSQSAVTILHGEVDQLAETVRSALPAYSRSNGLLSFCFVDPFAANVHFDTFRTLGQFRMDFLVLLMLGWDARVNFRRYLADRSSTRIADLIDCPNWRDDWDRSTDHNVIRFLLSKFDGAMTQLGYRSSQPSHYHTVTAHNKAVLQYVLVLYSKHRLGQEFWEQTLSRSSPQFGLPL